MSLEDSKAKKIANILSNKSCSKILDFLTENEATESEIAKKLKLPISTVHYNLKQLLEAKLIMWEKYHYSEKGKEVRHYTVANKYIIITPKGDSAGLMDKLKTLIPTFLFLGLGASAINWFNNMRTNMAFESNAMLADELSRDMPQMAGGYIAEDAVVNEAPMLMAKAMPETYEAMPVNDMVEPIVESIPWYQELYNYISYDLIYQNWFWFLVGALTGIGIYLLIKFIRKKLQ